MPLKLYNTLARKKEIFEPIEKQKVGIYTCGPTVHNFAHIGNFRSFIVEDLLIRYIDYIGYDITHVMNITDVDDKTIRKSKEAGMSLKDYTDKYTEEFMKDLDTLNIRRADYYPRATEHINEMVNMIKKIVDKDYAYKTDDNSVYFRISKMKDYGKLSGLDPKELKGGASGRVSADEYDRENISDFTLWKGYTEADGDVYWDSPFGKGRPGWHIECSAMSNKYLGDTFDIHCGGVDNMFPHHENEIAQSETATGKKFVNYWMHIEHLIFRSKNSDETEKMSKSLGNVLYVNDLIEKGYDGKAIRFTLLSGHYKQQLIFNEDRLNEYNKRLQRYQDFIERLKQVDNNNNGFDFIKLINTGYDKFKENMNDDLNISGALATIDDVISTVNKNFNHLNTNSANKILDYLKDLNKVLGIFSFEDTILDEEIEQMITERENARKEKKYQKADEIRNKLKSMGIILEDTPNGTKWKKLK